MYGTAKRLAIISGIFCAINALATVMGLIGLASKNLEITVEFTIAIFLISTTGVSLLVTIAAIDLCSALELTYDSSNEKIRKLEKRIQLLEENLKKS